MKTQCPNCKELWNIEEAEQGHSIKCFNCAAQFNAAPYIDPIPEDFIPKKEPGGLCQLIAVLTVIFGGLSVLVLLMMNLGAALVSVFLSFYSWNSLGKTMNRLQQVQEQVEELQRAINS